MQLLGYILTVIGFGAVVVKLYWDRRDLENQLYISKHVFFKEDTKENPLFARSVKRARKAATK